MASLLKISVLVIAITMAAATMTITFTMKAMPEAGPKPKPSRHPDDTAAPVISVPPSKRVSRFLQAATTSHPSANPRAADHCKNDNDICSILGVGLGAKCCNNKCMDLSSDKNNCGACKNKCKFTHTCCNGQCVMTMFDKIHCGRCNNRCPEGQYCVYGMCNYG